tara:strand:- start:74 stop:304 length:231 start_codon:yes stop_codon:yes gene_type:complete
MTTKTDPNKNYTIKEIYIKVKGDTHIVNDLGNKLTTLIDDLGWDYQRMSMSGREIYDDIQRLLGAIKEDEVYMELD